ncbi:MULTISPECIES: metallophosphoesterase family protein [unclassified Fusibacter]|uniref:metallophosphoesterase family protein n=1 Tax=unclassified Fusibacter TaxID=2624464 RepID=UPI0010123A97|nr:MULTISPECIES: metallophosphoesterase family protein [unclassified Fusibacter]MCK8060131.1 serine/threonine protein phosphatase [Fusibacter sp. A2]NPE22273.1 serine/threonine protein phosphatase [Fusibacter sp. A1]RXV61046.1 serine/threonine protein phosphatase [Fusibacter sp. A1]
MGYISKLENLKSDVAKRNPELTERKLLEMADWIDHRWSVIGDVFQDDLSSIIHDQQDLMAFVMKIHRNEQSLSLSKLLKQHNQFPPVLKLQTHVARAHRIYIMPDVEDTIETVMIGDIHSDPISCKAILKACDFFKKVADRTPIRLIFMGDYVDRGKAHLEMMDWIFALKYVFPEHVYLLRGNHDGGYIENNGTVKTPYRIPDHENPNDYFPPFIRSLEKENPSILSPILSDYLAFFESLATIAVFKKNEKVYMACHAGIARPLLEKEHWFDYIDSLSKLTDVSILDHVDRSIVQNIYWSDPREGDIELNWDSGRFKYNREHFEAYSAYLGIDVLFRGHEAEKEGVKEFFGGRVITVFSSGDSMNYGKNVTTAYLGITPKIALVTHQGVTYKQL